MATRRKLPINSVKESKENVSYHHKPEELSIEKWQIALRRQFVETRSFGIKKMDGRESPFGDYIVRNPETKNAYKVAFRGLNSSMNFCSCLDFKTNRLGTCKHLEALIFQLKNNPNIPNINSEYIPNYTSVYLSYKNGREVKIRIGRSSKSEFEELAKSYFDKDYTLYPEACDHFMTFLEKANAIDDDFRCYDDAFEFVLEARDHKLRKQIASKYNENITFADLLNANLFPYQQEGIRFAFEAGRSLNADEMGLGKTIQAIGVCQMFRKEQGIEKVLIICPTSLKYQWQSEIKKFTNEKAFVIEGGPHIRKKQYKQNDFYQIVSYNTVSNDIKEIVAQNFDMIILDEAQRIKNWKTKISQSVKKLHTPYCMVLTGTPLENKIEELYSIIQFVDPYLLGPYYHFLNYYQLKNGIGKVTGYQHLDEISALLVNTLKRRRKSEVLLQLPDRMDKNLFVPMTSQQNDLHEEFHDAVGKLVHKWRRQGFLIEKDRQRLLINLNQMRMSCDSTFLFDQTTRYDTKIDELMNILDEYFDGNQEKAVIFSQWERMTRIISQELDAAGIEYQYLHGGVPSKERKVLFDTFNQSATCRVFLSTDAGSTGLNLQAASLIVNMDIPWNPAVLEQRIARIHRMGQKSSVSVINFVSRGTIEERMLGVLKFKTSLAQGVLDQGESAIFLNDSKFNAFMKDVEQMTVQEEETSNIALIPDEEENMEVRESAEKEVMEPLIPGDDDFEPSDIQTFSTTDELQPETTKEIPADDASDLLAKGFSFLSGLAKIASTKNGVEQLAHSLVEKDDKTGKIHLKIPIESEETVSNVLNMLGNLFKGLGK